MYLNLYLLVTLQILHLVIGATTTKPPAISKVYNATIANGFVTFAGGGNPIHLTNGMTSSSIQV